MVGRQQRHGYVGTFRAERKLVLHFKFKGNLLMIFLRRNILKFLNVKCNINAELIQFELPKDIGEYSQKAI